MKKTLMLMMVDGAVQKTITFKFVKLREYGV